MRACGLATVSRPRTRLKGARVLATKDREGPHAGRQVWRRTALIEDACTLGRLQRAQAPAASLTGLMAAV